MKQCPYCKNIVEDALNYCPNCGATLGPANAVPPVVQAPQKAVVQECANACGNTANNDSTKNIIIVVLAIIIIFGAIGGIVLLSDDDKVSTPAPSVTTSNNNQVAQSQVTQQEARTENRIEKVPAPEPEGVRCEINGTRVNMREYPSMNARVIFQFPGYEIVYVTAKSNASDGKYPWYRTSYNGHIGWVYGQFVREADYE